MHHFLGGLPSCLLKSQRLFPCFPLFCSASAPIIPAAVYLSFVSLPGYNFHNSPHNSCKIPLGPCSQLFTIITNIHNSCDNSVSIPLVHCTLGVQISLPVVCHWAHVPKYGQFCQKCPKTVIQLPEKNSKTRQS